VRAVCDNPLLIIISEMASQEKSDTLGSYKLLKKLGEGAFAKVYSAQHQQQTSVTYAVKVMLKSRLDSDERLSKALANEIEIMRDFNHAGICRLFEHFSTEQHICLVIEYCGGGDLKKYLKKNGGKLNEVLVRKFTTQLAEGLQFLHAREVIHRDIKSQVCFIVISIDEIMKIS